MKFSGKIGNGPMNNCLNFGGYTDHRLDTGIVLRIWYLRDTESLTALQLWRYLHHRSTIARQRLCCTQRAVSPAHDIARLVRRAWRRYALSQWVLVLILNIFNLSFQSQRQRGSVYRPCYCGCVAAERRDHRAECDVQPTAPPTNTFTHIDWHTVDWLRLGFTSHSTQNRSLRRHSSQPISSLVLRKQKSKTGRNNQKCTINQG